MWAGPVACMYKKCIHNFSKETNSTYAFHFLYLHQCGRKCEWVHQPSDVCRPTTSAITVYFVRLTIFFRYSFYEFGSLAPSSSNLLTR
jgi:hypothetical protein